MSRVNSRSAKTATGLNRVNSRSAKTVTGLNRVSSRAVGSVLQKLATTEGSSLMVSIQMTQCRQWVHDQFQTSWQSAERDSREGKAAAVIILADKVVLTVCTG